MKKLLVFLFTTILFTACNNNEDEPTLPVKDNAPVTVWAYLVADTNIKSDLRNNIKNMYEGLSKMDKQATLLVYWDGGTSDAYFSTSPAIFQYKTDGYGNINGVAARDSSYSILFIAQQAEILKSYSDQLSSDKSIMTLVLKDMKNFTKTNKMILVAGSHGSAWTESIFAPKNRAFGQDGSGTDNTIATWDMADAIKDAGIKLDLLLFDACMMGTAEVCYDFRDVANYLIVSSLDVPAPGFPYHNFMTNLYEGTVKDFTEVCKHYVDFYRYYPSGWASVALIDINQINALASSIKQQLKDNKDKIFNYNPIGKLQHYGLNSLATGFKYISFDMNQFIQELNGGITPQDFMSQLNKTVLYADCLEDTEYYTIEKSKFCGLGMYIPVSVRQAWNSTFKTIDWYKAAGWDEITFNWDK